MHDGQGVALSLSGAWRSPVITVDVPVAGAVRQSVISLLVNARR